MASPRSTTRRRRGSDIVKEMKIRLTVLRERVTPDMVDQYVGIDGSPDAEVDNVVAKRFNRMGFNGMHTTKLHVPVTTTVGEIVASLGSKKVGGQTVKPDDLQLVLEDEVLDVDDPIGNVGAMDGDLLILRPVMKSMVNQVLPLVGLSQSGKELLTRLLGGSEDGNTEHAVRRILRKHSSLGSLPQHNQSSSKQEDDVHHEDWGSDLNVKRVDSMRSVADSHHGTPKSSKSNESGELELLMDRLGSGNSFGSDYLSRPPSIPEHGDVPDGVFGWGSGSLQGSGKLALHAALDSPAPLSPSPATNSQTGSPTRRRRGSRHRQTQPQSRPPALDTSAKPASQASLRSSTTDEDGPERNAQVTMGGRKPSFLYHYPRPHDPLRSPLRADEFTFGTGAGTNGGGPPGATAGAGGGAGAGSQERRHGGSYIEDKHLVRSSSAASQGSVKGAYRTKSLESIDYMEGGKQVKLMDPNMLRPIPRDEPWRQHIVHKQKNVFVMTEDGSDEVKLCAVQADYALFYISHLDTFPEFFDVDKPLNQQARKATYQARVIASEKSRRYQIVMVRCQNCDERLGKYECGKGHTEMRQVVANITQSTRNVHDSVSLRRMDVSLPRVFPSEAACVWCPRNPKGSGNGRSVPPRPISGSQLKLEREAAHVEDTLQLSTVLPQWSPEQGGLTMEFVGDRVAKTSSKNFLFQVVNDGAEVLQFGKLGAGRYSLDFGYPITPMQAFGLFLCSFGWVGPTTA